MAVPRRRALLTGTLALALALAGCLGGPKDEPEPVPPPPMTPPEDAGVETEMDPEEYFEAMRAAYEEEAQRTQAEAEAQDEGEAPRHEGPPAPRLRVIGPDGQPANGSIGSAPHTVTLSIAGDISTLFPYWALHHNRTGYLAEGLELPATFEHTFLAPGAHTMSLVLSDGARHEVDQIIIIVDRPPAPGDIQITDTVTGVWTPYVGYLPDIHTHDFFLAVPVARITVNVTGELTALDLDIELVAPDGTIAGRHNGFNEPTGAVHPAHETPIVVTDPALTYQMGEWILRVKPGLAAAGDYVLRVSFET